MKVSNACIVFTVFVMFCLCYDGVRDCVRGFIVVDKALRVVTLFNFFANLLTRFYGLIISVMIVVV